MSRAFLERAALAVAVALGVGCSSGSSNSSKGIDAGLPEGGTVTPTVPVACALDCFHICLGRSTQTQCGNGLCGAWDCDTACQASTASWCCVGETSVVGAASESSCPTNYNGDIDPCPANPAGSTCGQTTTGCDPRSGPPDVWPAVLASAARRLPAAVAPATAASTGAAAAGSTRAPVWSATGSAPTSQTTLRTAADAAFSVPRRGQP